MEETFFKRVNYPENKPEKEGEYHVYFNNGAEAIYKYDTKEGKFYYEDCGCPIYSQAIHSWLKPLPILSRDKMIEVIKKTLYPLKLKDDVLNSLADAILKAGLPEPLIHKPETVEIKKAGRQNCPNCKQGIVHIVNNFCPSCGSKITWIS